MEISDGYVMVVFTKDLFRYPVAEVVTNYNIVPASLQAPLQGFFHNSTQARQLAHFDVFHPL